MTQLAVGDHFRYKGVRGQIVRVASHRIEDARNVWWKSEDTDTETMFSLRADGVWRAFPGPTDGESLQEARKQRKVKR